MVDGFNSEPEGFLTISDSTPTEGQLLTVSAAGVTMPTVSPTNPDGAITGPISYFWQSEVRPGVFEDILIENAGGEEARATGPTFTPGELQVGLALRVRAVYKDGNDVLEEVYLDADGNPENGATPTAPVANVNDTPIGTVVISDPTPTETQALVAINQFTDADGLVNAVFNYQWQQSALGGGAIFTNIAGATTQSFTPTQAQVNRQLRVVVTYTDDQGTLEPLTSTATTIVGDALTGNGNANILTGTEGQDIISGLGGADVLNGLGGADILNGDAGADAILAGAGDDLISGGAGSDALSGEAGNDTFNYTFGDGADAVDGGADLDTLNISGTAAANVLDVIFDGTVLTQFEGGTLTVTNVESVTANLLGGTDTLTYAGTTADVTVNLSTGAASGFSLIAGIENITSGSGNDTLTGDALVNNLNGGAGNDTLDGGLGNDTLVGGTGNDIYFANNGDILTEGGGVASGIDSVLMASNTFTLAANVENLTFTGIGDFTGTGNGSANVIIGGSGNDTLTGLGGTDTLNGGAGNDTLIGGTGNDVLSGEAGNDIFTYNFGDGADTIDGGADSDTLNIVGTGGNNTLDVLFNGTALTQFEGGTLTVANVESVTADLGANAAAGDTLSYAGTTADVTVNLSTGAASGFASVANIENVAGGAGNDTLTGNTVANNLNGGSGNDTLFGLDGADTLLGGAGVDRLTGGAGNDTMNGGADPDVFVFASGFGNDTINGGSTPMRPAGRICSTSRRYGITAATSPRWRCEHHGCQYRRGGSARHVGHDRSRLHRSPWRRWCRCEHDHPGGFHCWRSERDW